MNQGEERKKLQAALKRLGVPSGQWKGRMNQKGRKKKASK